ncbi:hypothetical protein ACFX4N_23890 [Priestia sp. YIM B13551]|uniref:hypothetical protein n=1 Tax=Priestia sp. YIM B13551 TaxID=3366306 RepID=UPI0036704E67
MPRQIRVLNQREYDMSSYTKQAHRKAVHLFESHKNANIRLNELKKNYSLGWMIEDQEEILSYQKEKRELMELVRLTEDQLIALDRDYRSHKGFSFRKIIHPLVRFIISKGFPYLLGAVYLGGASYQYIYPVVPTNDCLKIIAGGLILMAFRTILRHQRKIRLKERAAWNNKL